MTPLIPLTVRGTSELKVKVICSELRRRFKGQTILNCSGIRRAESPKRKLAKIAKPQPELGKPGRRDGTRGLDWNPIIEWSHLDVYAYLAAKDFALHEAYTKYSSSRVSCIYCIMSKWDDLVASSTCPDNHDVYREMVGLEVDSTFAFQGATWLGDVAPHLLDLDTYQRLQFAKDRAAIRAGAEAWLPEHLLFEDGWPNIMPTPDEAEKIAAMRRSVAEAVRITGMQCLTGPEVSARYAQLIAEKARRAS